MTELYNDNLHKGAIGKLYEYGRELRQSGTDAEKILWKELRNRKLNGLKFRRQHPIDKFIADFYCHEKKLIIELDGAVHDAKENKEYDANRTYMLKEIGIMVIRFRNEEVIKGITEVLRKINEYVMNSD
ncbi:MAG: endonuclease domain-containing protein [Sphingobacteriales bacterium]|nr:endonuclease domain-containing protein [Sphingobacteriales bacterium]MBI3717788.1 endonuclease domain-containing protein [Sphingobacteriales bacterium]